MDELNSSSNIPSMEEESEEEVANNPEIISAPVPEPAVKPPSGQSTLFGGEQ